MKTRLLLAPIVVLVLAGCAPAATGPAPSAAPTSATSHGERPGATELSEPQNTLLAVGDDGAVDLLDLLTEEAHDLGTIAPPTSIDSDGRFGFVTTDRGIEVIDSGVWTWDHGDHFHYYRAEPQLPGTIPGEGPATVSTPPLSTAGATGIFFAGSGEAVAVDMAALDRGEISEWFRVSTDAERGVVAPVGQHAIVALDDGSDAVAVYDEDGERVEGASGTCVEPTDAIATRAGTVIACADGALLAMAESGSVEFAAIPAPDDAARATDFAGRKNRPTVAALSGDRAFWLLDVRERAWERVEVEHDLVQVVAADDADGNVVAIDADGAVRVFGPDGGERGVTDPIAQADSTLTVDTTRAYVSSPADGAVYEIDYGDDARISRVLTPAASLGVAIEVGR